MEYSKRKSNKIKYNDKVMKDIREYLNGQDDIGKNVWLYEMGYIRLSEFIDITFGKIDRSILKNER